MNLIEAKNLTKSYHNQKVVKRINLQIQKGKLTALLGTNGAGKSTTISMLIGLLKQTSGDILYRNQSGQKIKIGVVFQQSVLDAELSVWDNLKIRAKLYPKQPKNYFNQLIKLTGLARFVDQKYGHLSGGQKRRVDIVRALLNQPDILVLDEPTTGLDIQTRQAIWKFIAMLQKENQLTVFLTTHYLEEANSAEQIYIMSKGLIVAEGSADEIIQKYSQPTLRLMTKDILQLQKDLENQDTDKTDTSLILHPNSADEAIEILKNHQTQITNFNYKPGDLNDAFIALTGKEMR